MLNFLVAKSALLKLVYDSALRQTVEETDLIAGRYYTHLRHLKTGFQFLGLEVCIGMMTHLDTSTDQLDPTDPNFYVYCACQKSTIVRSPGV